MLQTTLISIACQDFSVVSSLQLKSRYTAIGSTATLGGLNGFSRTSPTPTQHIGYTATQGGLSGISRNSATPTQRGIHHYSRRPQWHQPDLPHSTATLGTPQLWEASMASAGPPPIPRNIGYNATRGGLKGFSRTSPTPTQHCAHRNYGRPQWLEPPQGSPGPDPPTPLMCCMALAH